MLTTTNVVLWCLLVLWLADVCLAKLVTSYDVLEHGVVGNGRHDDTEALQQLLDSVPPHSIVIVPAGCTVVTGPLTIRKDDMTLQIDGTVQAWDVTVHILDKIWPKLPPLPTYGDSRDVGMYLQYQALLYASNVKRIRITGVGVVDGRGNAWWDYFRNNSKNRTTYLKAGRPNLIQIVNSTNVVIDSIHLRDSPFWTLHPVLCESLTIRGITIDAPLYAPNVDGIDIDSCRNVLIEYVDVACGDDHIAIKAGVCGESSPNNNCSDAVWSSMEGGSPYRTDNVTVRYSTFRRGMGIAIGSEMSGGVTNVHIYNNTVGVCETGPDTTHGCGWGPALHVKTTITRGGRIENITFADNTVWHTSMFILLEMGYQSDGNAVPPDGYNATVVRNVSFVGNKALGTASAAIFSCSKYDACHEIIAVNNFILHFDSSHSPWQCQFIASDFVAQGNIPFGLEDCMAHSMSNISSLGLPTLAQQH